jgi:hypothetical protein
MQTNKEPATYELILSEFEIKRLSRDLHRWYLCSTVNDDHVEQIQDELAEGEVEFGLSFMITLQEMLDAKP